MPYISAEDVKAKRKEIRAAFPAYKFSVTRGNHSSINVSILSGPLALTERADGHEQVNHFYIDEHFEDHPEVAALLTAVRDIAMRGQSELVYDSDYGSVPTFYIHLAIGKWNLPYEVKAAA
jgi:hypothetical protein